jgi:hypothetical protein
MFNATAAKYLRWIATQNGSMVQVFAANAEGGFLSVATKHYANDTITAEGVSKEEAVCEALIQAGLTFDESFDLALSAKVEWQ